MFEYISPKELITYSFTLIAAILLAVVIAWGGIITAFALIVMPFILAFLIWLFRIPVVGIESVIILGFIVNGITRYVPGPFGLSVDAVLVLTLLAVIFKSNKIVLKKISNTLMVVVGIWFAYTLFQIINPEARSFEAWFYAVRGVSLYMILFIPIVFILYSEPQHLDKFIKIWFIVSVLAALWSIKQIFLGVDSFEKKWLDEGAATTHVLMGKLRAFSFYSDAGQFGAAMGHTGLAASILALGAKEKLRKYLFLATALLCFYGMLLSGTRGALFVPMSGFFMYFILSKNIKVLVIGMTLGIMFFVGLKYTTIGQTNDQVRRMRTALDPENASLQVRLDNQKKLSSYLATRPIGGGIGSAGGWGQRFSPGTFLAETALDSWYVKVWAEGGIVGLILFIGLVLYVLIDGFIKIFWMPDSDLRYKLMALYCGFFGISVASYGNQIFGQSPTSFILYGSMVYLFLGEKLSTPTAESLTT